MANPVIRLALGPDDMLPALPTLVRTEAPDFEVSSWPLTGSGRAITYAACRQMPDGFLDHLSDLEVLFVLAAGIDHIDFSAIPDHVAVARMVDPSMTRGMVEYALAAVFALHRDFDTYIHLRQRRAWTRLPRRLAQDRRVGILGLGALGRAIAEALVGLGFGVSGWSRSARQIDGVICHHGPAGLDDLLAEAEILISILPVTDQTRDLLNKDRLARMPRGAALVNIGRGAHVVDADLLAALDSGQLRAAILDVFRTEPPAANDPLWTHPRVILTPHVASGADPDSIARTLVARIRRHAAGDGIDHLVDRRAGY